MKSSQSSSQQDLQFKDEEWFNGSIKSISLENFMCHSNFHLTLNPRINFISGLNGSGKSAIQTALVVGFGARASITNRASSLKTLIKYGCSSATISITIANGNETNASSVPFRPEVYGKQITVVRQITDSSNIPYKFLNESGRVVKGYKNELKNLILHFNILVDNPTCVMNQATVKTFHKSSNASDKYDLFYRAISADIYNNNIIETNNVAQEYSKKLKEIRSVLDQYFEEVREFEAYEKKNEELNNLKNNMKKIENEYAWCSVFKHEKNYEECLQQIELQKKKVLLGTDKLITLEENIKTSSETILIKKNELNNIEETRSRNHFLLMEKKKELQNKKDEQEIIQQKIRRADNSYQILLGDRKELEKHIEVERQRGNTNTLAQYKEKLAFLEQNIAEVEAAWKTNMEHEQTLRNTVDDLNQKIGNLKNNVVAPMQKQVVEINRNINNMSQQGDRINFYANWMPHLVNSIENAFKHKQFTKKPIGPIGEYIKVNNDKWIFSIENHLGRGILRTFLVDNFNDNKVLQSIMDKVLPANVRKPSVITSKFFAKVHDVADNETKNSMLKMLTFTNSVVANCLIDNNQIETIMLVDNVAEAMSLMEDESRVPRNCKYSLTSDGTQVYPSPSYRLYSLQNPSEPILLQSDVSVAVNSLKLAKKELEVKINSLNNEFNNILQSKLEKDKLLKKTQSETRLLKLKYDEYFKKINEIKAKCEEEQDDRMAALTEEINDVDLKIAKTAKSKEDILKSFPINEKTIADLNERVNELKAIIADIDQPAISEQIGSLQTQINKCKTEIAHINNNLAERKKLLENLTKQSEVEKNSAEKNKRYAEQFCEKMEISRSEEDIKRDLEGSRQKCKLLELELSKKSGYNVDMFKADYMNKKQKYIEQAGLHKKIVDIYKTNKASVEISTGFLKNYINYLSLKVIESFDVVLLLRKIKGKLNIDHESKSMVITMFENISTSCASGGERTFATVALILALWNNIELPFYSIDEYDVYMDNVNRLATTQMLMMAIEERKNQFIFLTPQDISHIKSAHNIKIVKLKEPRS